MVDSTLDLSFNLLKSVPETITTLPSLGTLYFVQNKISKISNLHNSGASLRSLELGGNRIRVSCLSSHTHAYTPLKLPESQTIENLDALVNLEELWLGKNKLSKIEVCRVPPSITSAGCLK